MGVLSLCYGPHSIVARFSKTMSTTIESQVFVLFCREYHAIMMSRFPVQQFKTVLICLGIILTNVCLATSQEGAEAGVVATGGQASDTAFFGKTTSTSSSAFQIIRDVNGYGGEAMTGKTMNLHGTVSQSSIGRLRRPNGSLHNVGFWYWAKSSELYACVRMPLAQAEPGTVLNIPLLLEESSRLPVNGTLRFRARIRYNRTLLQPVNGTPECQWDGDDCILEVEGVVTANSIETGVLANLQFLAKLGNAESTPLTIESLSWSNVGERTIRTVLKPGLFTLLGVCRVGGEIRLIHSTGPATRVRVWPNPAADQINVEFISREEGTVSLELVDAIGRQVGTLAEQQVDAVRLYSVALDLSNVASGTYFLVLRTPTDVKTTRLTVEH